MQLGGLGEIKPLGMIERVHDVAELLREAEDADRGLEELGGVVEAGELECLGSDLAVGVGDLGSDVADGGMEVGDGGAEGEEGGVGFPDGEELREEVVVAGEDLGAELLLEEADAVLELLGAGGGGAGGEGQGGEAGGVEVVGEESGEYWVGSQGIERSGSDGGGRRC